MAAATLAHSWIAVLSTPPNVNNWLAYGPFSLAGATAAELELGWWLESEDEFDTFLMLVSADGDTWHGWEASGFVSDWQDFTMDFADVPDIGSVVGQGQGVGGLRLHQR